MKSGSQNYQPHLISHFLLDLRVSLDFLRVKKTLTTKYFSYSPAGNTGREICYPSNHVVVYSLTSRASLWNYIYAQMSGRKTGMGLITHDITFWKYQNIYCILPIFSICWHGKLCYPYHQKESKKKKEIQISRCEWIDEVEKL